MNTSPVPTFIETIRQIGLLADRELDEIRTLLDSRFADQELLAEELVRRKWLTKYQTEELLAGRGQGLVFGPYVVLDCLGAGGMGRVFKARHRLMQRIVALKVIRQEHLANPAAVPRFYREIEALAQLKHPNVMFAHHADKVGDHLFLVMEYVQGADLAHRIRENGPLPISAACEYIRQAALGLQHIHERGLVHRDIKPSNLLLSADGNEVKVLDLGLARLVTFGTDGANPATLTHSGAIMGTMDYLAPEQAIDSRAVDIRADIYSLGCTLYHLLTGNPPFPNGTPAQKIAQHLQGTATPVQSLRPEVSAGLASLVHRMMAKDPEARYQIPAEVAQALQPFSEGQSELPSNLPEPTRPLPKQVGKGELSPRPLDEGTAWSTDWPPIQRAPAPQPKRHRPMLAGLLALLVLVALVAALVGLGFHQRSIVRGSGADDSTAEVPSPPQPGEEIRNRIGMRLVFVPAGHFRMGSPNGDRGERAEEGRKADDPLHSVEITRPFYMGVCEVTRGQFGLFVEETMYRTEAEEDGKGGWGFSRDTNDFEGPDPKYSWRNPGFPQTDEHPVINITWNDAHRFCRWLRDKEGKTYRLPTEAEWEYACRARVQTPFQNGSDGEALAEIANVADASFKERFPDWTTIKARDGYVFTAPVGRFKPNAFGLSDMHGNVCEWCEDGYDAEYYPKSPQQDPPGPTSPGHFRVMRGGSFISSPASCGAATRGKLEPSLRTCYLGFRVVRER